MSIISIQRDQNNNISIVRMQVSDTLETVSMTDYILDNQEQINALNGGTWQWFISDMILVAAEDGNAFYEFVDTTFATIVIFGEKSTGTINPGLTNNIPYYAANGNTLSPISSMANAVLATNNSSVPALTQTLPGAVQANITALGTIGTGVWQGTNVAVGFGGTGNDTFTAYSVICAGTTATGAFQNVSGLGTSGYILTSNGAGTLPTWQANAASGTVSPGTANDLAYYASTGSTVSPLTTSASSVLITSGLGVPSWASHLALALGGTNAALTATAGAIAYSTASALALTAAGSSGQIFQSAGTSAPGWTTATYPSTAGTQYNVLQSTGTNITSATLTSVIDGAIGSTQGNILYRNSTVWTVLAPGTNGYFLQTQGASANPQWAAPTGSGTVNSGTQYYMAYYATTGTAVSGLATANNSVLATNGSGVPAYTTSLPSAVQVGVNSLNSGTSASSSTFWRGDGSWASVTPSYKAPTIQQFTSGSGTYTTPTSPAPLYIRAVMVGAGGGSGGSGNGGGTAAGNGGDTTFGTSLLKAGGGVGGGTNASPGGAGGTASLGSGPIGIALPGGEGGAPTYTDAYAGGMGGSSAFGGAGGNAGGSSAAIGGAGGTNTGGGGGGSGGGYTFAGSGGGSGAYVDAIITSPSATYSYAVGAAGTAGGAGSGGQVGAAGGSGLITIYEYYQ